jgi:hypothetical protein
MRFQNFIAVLAYVVSSMADHQRLRSRDASHGCPVVWVAEDNHLSKCQLEVGY